MATQPTQPAGEGMADAEALDLLANFFFAFPEFSALHRSAKAVYDHFKSLIAERDALRTDRDRLAARCEGLSSFAKRVIVGAQEGGSFDGCDIEDVALDCGLLAQVDVDESCGEGCVCAEYGFPTACNRHTELLTGLFPPASDADGSGVA